MSSDCYLCGRKTIDCECTPKDFLMDEQKDLLENIDDKLNKIIELLENNRSD